MSDISESIHNELSDSIKNTSDSDTTNKVAKINTEEVFKDHPVHLLDSTWTLWYTRPKTNKKYNWKSQLQPIADINSIEEFWALNAMIPTIEDIPVKTDYHLFRKNIRPEWEDENNSKGGKIIIEFNDYERMNTVWINLMIMAICEHFEDLQPLNEADNDFIDRPELFYEIDSTKEEIDDHTILEYNKSNPVVNGVVFSKRYKNLRVSLWVKYYFDKMKSIQIALKVRGLVIDWLKAHDLDKEYTFELKEEEVINYGSHENNKELKETNIVVKFLTLNDNIHLISLPIEKR